MDLSIGVRCMLSVKEIKILNKKMLFLFLKGICCI